MLQARRYIVNVCISAVIACVTAKRPAFMAELIPSNITVYNETQFPSRNQLSNMEIIYVCVMLTLLLLCMIIVILDCIVKQLSSHRHF